MHLGLYITAALLACAAPAYAYQPYESTANARLDQQGVELVVTVLAGIVTQLVGQPLTGAAELERL
jgi:hypothetical protein